MGVVPGRWGSEKIADRFANELAGTKRHEAAPETSLSLKMQDILGRDITGLDWPKSSPAHRADLETRRPARDTTGPPP